MVKPCSSTFCLASERQSPVLQNEPLPVHGCDRPNITDYITEEGRIFQGTILLMVCFVTLFGNVLLWITVLRYKEFHKSMYILLLNLSASDLMIGVLNMPLMAYTLIVGR
ncbi:hypothetical protein ACOMHN_059913 [Nucella lapillus]